MESAPDLLVFTVGLHCSQIEDPTKQHTKLHLVTHPWALRRTTDTRLHIVRMKTLILLALTIRTQITSMHHLPSPETTGLRVLWNPLVNLEKFYWADILV